MLNTLLAIVAVIAVLMARAVFKLLLLPFRGLRSLRGLWRNRHAAA